MQIPAVCSACGYTFPSIVGGEGRVRTLGLLTLCPRCGRKAKILDGYFNLLSDTIRLVDGPDFTKEVLEAIFGAIEEVRADPGKRDEVVAELAKKNPVAAANLREWLNVSAACASAIFAGLIYLQTVRSDQNDVSISERMLTINERLLAYMEEHYPADQSIQEENPPQTVMPAEEKSRFKGKKPRDNHYKRRVDRAIKRRMSEH